MARPPLGARAVGVFGAELEMALRRRAIKLCAAAALGLLILISWSNHRLVEDSRIQVAALRRPIDFSQFPPSVRPSEEEVRDIERARREAIASEIRRQEAIQAELSPGRSYRVVAGLAGTLPGVTLATLLAATFFGADFRWGYWSTILLHEPRRWHVVASKLVTLWCLLLFGMVLLLAASYPVDLAFAQLFRMPTNPGWPAATTLAARVGSAWLATATYVTAAAAAALWGRASLAGAVGGLGFLLADGFTVPHFPSVRAFSAVQQVAAMLHTASVGGGPVATIWFPRIEARALSAGSQANAEILVPLAPIRPAVAVAILLGWIALFTAAAVAAMSARDVPT